MVFNQFLSHLKKTDMFFKNAHRQNMYRSRLNGYAFSFMDDYSDEKHTHEFLVRTFEEKSLLFLSSFEIYYNVFFLRNWLLNQT